MPTQGNQEEDVQGTPPVDNSQTVPPETKERYKEILSGKEKQLADVERARLVEKTARHVLNNQELLLDIDPELGKEVIKTLHSEGLATTDDYDSILESIKDSKKPNNSEVDVERLVDERLRKKEEEKLYAETDKLVQEWLKAAPEDKRDEMRAEFEDLSDWRKLKPEKAKKFMEKIEAVYRKNDLESERRDNTFARMASSPLQKNGEPAKAPKWTVELARKLGYTERDMKEMGLL